MFDFLPAEAQLHRHRDRLLALVGRRVTGGWTAWFPDRDRMYPGAPAVLAFDGAGQVALAWQKWDELSITWDAVDVDAPAGPFEWRPTQPDEVASVVGRTVTGIAVSEGPYFNDVDLQAGGPLPVHAIAGWVVDGLWLETGDAGLLVHNGADTVALSPSPMTPDHDGLSRTTPLAAFDGAG
jgi:hypothetical protein